MFILRILYCPHLDVQTQESLWAILMWTSCLWSFLSRSLSLYEALQRNVFYLKIYYMGMLIHYLLKNSGNTNVYLSIFIKHESYMFVCTFSKATKSPSIMIFVFSFLRFLRAFLVFFKFYFFRVWKRNLSHFNT